MYNVYVFSMAHRATLRKACFVSPTDARTAWWNSSTQTTLFRLMSKQLRPWPLRTHPLYVQNLFVLYLLVEGRKEEGEAIPYS